MSQENTECQSAVTNCKAILDPFLEEVTHTLKATGQPVNLQLNEQQLPIFTALLGQKDAPAILAADGKPSALQQLVKASNTWAGFLGVNKSWRLILDHIVEQEIAGDIVTDLSISVHLLLQNYASPTYNFIFPSQAIEEYKIPDPTEYQALTQTLTAGQTIDRQSFIKHLSKVGYTRHEKSLEAGSCRVRGEQIDIYHPTHLTPITLTFLGNTIESITSEQNRRRITHNSIAIPPVSFPTEQVPLLEILKQFTVARPATLNNLPANQTIVTDSVAADITFPLQPTEKITHQPLHVFYTNQDRIKEYLDDQQLPYDHLCKHPLATIPTKLQHPSVSILTESAIFPEEEATTTAPISQERAFELIASLEVNKHAVHADHGIGIFEGLQHRTIDDIEKEYLIVRYAEGDVLSVPVEYAHKITPYVGEGNPPIYRLGGTIWKKARQQAEEDAAAFAKELLDIAGQRQANTRAPYHIDSRLEETLEKEFPYDLTPDQDRTLQEVLEDLQKPEPMDRLIVGDVGFGKTEVAIRAARHAVNNGKQVAVLAPTTLLVQQHADTFTSRLADIKDSIGMLSRFVSTKEQHEVKEKVQQGKKSIIIGTHALLSPSMKWKDLGLVIIDEEQQFGVKQKEQLKKLRANLDVLSLSATPIPRTLSMALSGLRGLSLITTAPSGRQSVATHVGKLKQSTLTKAITQELDRQGQVYIVAPKVRQLGAIAEQVQQIAPHAKTAIAHGQLPSNQLSNIMHQFDEGRVDILISSSIIENGLDLPNANTLIVWQATHFGLADLYQLRGRVGRRHKQGYAYFLYKQDELTSQQRQRLTALTEASRLGSGWTIARRDLEIRGAGNLLGSQQSGSANTVGVQLYLDLVSQATKTNQGQKNLSLDTDIQLPITAIIPAHYISDTGLRSRWYQKLARTSTQEQLEENVRELTNTFGPLPTETQNLINQLQLQRLASLAGITKISSKAITPNDEDPYARLQIWAKKLPETLHRLQPLGNWVVRQDHITLDMDAVNSSVVTRMIELLQQA